MSEKPGRVVSPILILLLAVALALRLYGIGWDQGSFFHPDERSIYMRVDCMYRLLTEAPGYQECTRDAPFQRVVPGIPSPTVFLDATKSPLNPHWFPLGNMILYLLLGIKLLLAPIVSMDLQDLALAGRSLSALADVGTVALVFFLGRRLYSRTAGLLAAALVTFSVTHIQHSHYYRPETLTILFTLASFWFMLQVAERRRLRDSVWLGVFLGLAFATKVSVLPLLLPVAVVYGYLLWRALRDPEVGQRANHAERAFLYGVATMAVSVGVYLFWTPYALLGFPEFLEWNLRELEVVRKAGIVPYTVQYMGAPKFLYELRQTVVWGLGLPLGVLAWGGLLVAVVLNVLKPRLGQTLLLLWAIPLLLTVASVQVKFLRYAFPLMPVFILMGSGTAWMGLRWLKEWRRGLGVAASVVLGLVLAATVFYGLAFMAVYSRPHTAVQASRWLNANVAYGMHLLTDNHWDEGIPDVGRYQVTQLPMFEGDTPRKMESVASILASGDYLVFYSNRTYGAIARVPERYPFSSAYYRLLFSGDLGYELVKGFSSYPRLLGLAFVDDPFGRGGVEVPAPWREQSPAPLVLNLGYADNDVITYDHPLVLVFKNTARFDRSYLLSLFQRSGATGVPDAVREPALMLTPEELALQRGGGTWADLFADGPARRFPVVVWLLVVEVAALATLPMGFVVFRGLYDRGYLLTKALAVLLVVYIPWLLAALKLMSFGRLSIYLTLAGLAVAGATITTLRRRDILAFLRRQWRTLALEEVLFLVAFGVFLAVRWANPDLWHPYRGGEKPMDFAYLNAIVRSSTVPPYDPWFAGGYLNYYYFGQFIVATWIKATGVLPEVAYNLAVPLLFALTAGGAFSVVYNLTSAWRQSKKARLGRRWGPVAAGLAAALVVVVAGNLGGAIQIIKAAWEFWTLDTAFPAFDFWASSRMMPGQISITEFPFWTFLFADLHAHLIVLPFTLLALGLSLNLVLAADGQDLRWPAWTLLMLFLALAVGSLAAINTWDYPTYLLVALGAVFLAMYRRRRRLDLLLLRQVALGAIAVVGLSYMAYLPFHARYVNFNAGLHASAQQTNPLHYLAVYGVFLFLALTYLAYEGARYLGSVVWKPRASAVPSLALVGRSRGAFGQSPLVPVVVAATGALVAYLVAAQYATVAMLLVLVLGGAALGVQRLREGGNEAVHHLFLLGLLGVVFILGIAVDLVTLNNDIDRMNTVFKTYLQGWVLYGIASATILWYLSTWLRRSQGKVYWAVGVWLVLLVILVAGISVFPLLGTRARLADRFSTAFTGLNGAQYMENTVYRDANGPLELRWDWEAIRWLREHVEGSPVVAEGNTYPHQYRWGSRVSIYTGLPTIVGWDWHQTQQRMGEQEEVRRRLAELTDLYTTTDIRRAERILRAYDVRYIYVGELERRYYSRDGLAKFQRMENRGVTPVYTNPQVTIYVVRLADEGQA